MRENRRRLKSSGIDHRPMNNDVLNDNKAEPKNESLENNQMFQSKSAQYDQLVKRSEIV